MEISIIFLAIGIIIGFGLGRIPTKRKDKKPYLRRGIYNRDYTATKMGNSETISVQFEIGEVESTGTKSKIEIISYKVNKTGYNSMSDKTMLYDLVNNSWVEQKDIEWIVDSAAEMRDKKINEILS